MYRLKTLNTRNRNRVIFKVAQALKIPIPAIEDYHANDTTVMMNRKRLYSDVYDKQWSRVQDGPLV